jgi:hypothetical protein
MASTLPLLKAKLPEVAMGELEQILLLKKLKVIVPVGIAPLALTVTTSCTVVPALAPEIATSLESWMELATLGVRTLFCAEITAVETWLMVGEFADVLMPLLGKITLMLSAGEFPVQAALVARLT